jgi:hypothetical protein
MFSRDRGQRILSDSKWHSERELFGEDFPLSGMALATGIRFVDNYGHIYGGRLFFWWS